MSMGMNEMFGRGIGLESSGLVSLSRAITSHFHVLLESYIEAHRPYLS